MRTRTLGSVRGVRETTALAPITHSRLVPHTRTRTEGGSGLTSKPRTHKLVGTAFMQSSVLVINGVGFLGSHVVSKVCVCVCDRVGGREVAAVMGGSCNEPVPDPPTVTGTHLPRAHTQSLSLTHPLHARTHTHTICTPQLLERGHKVLVTDRLVSKQPPEQVSIR